MQSFFYEVEHVRNSRRIYLGVVAEVLINELGANFCLLCQDLQSRSRVPHLVLLYLPTAVFETIGECGNQMLPASNFGGIIDYISTANVES